MELPLNKEARKERRRVQKVLQKYEEDEFAVTKDIFDNLSESVYENFSKKFDAFLDSNEFDDLMTQLKRGNQIEEGLVELDLY